MMHLNASNAKVL